jgi:SAM-dependent methyltransferase
MEASLEPSAPLDRARTGAPLAAEMVTHCCELLRPRFADEEVIPSGLVVGCGNGEEVVYMRQAFRSRRVVGIDIGSTFSSEARRERCLVQADAKSLPFQSGAFDFAAAFHSLEHVGDPRLALSEVSRVLRPGAWFYVGVPNKSRFVGYLGSPEVTTWQKIVWNLADWKARLRGRFENALGAHAGFGRTELVNLLEERFESIEVLTEAFIRFKYHDRLPRSLLKMLLAPRIINFSAPAHYVICRKRRLGPAQQDV